jgi:hypothetical protein
VKTHRTIGRHQLTGSKDKKRDLPNMAAFSLVNQERSRKNDLVYDTKI